MIEKTKEKKLVPFRLGFGMVPRSSIIGTNTSEQKQRMEAAKTARADMNSNWGRRKIIIRSFNSEHLNENLPFKYKGEIGIGIFRVRKRTDWKSNNDLGSKEYDYNREQIYYNLVKVLNFKLNPFYKDFTQIVHVFYSLKNSF